MLKTLRQRLILSHILPLLVIVPIMGIALIYTLETKVLLPDLARELTGQAQLVGELAGDRPDIWHNQVQAEAFVRDMNGHLSARVMLLDAGGRLLASSDPADAIRLNEVLDQPALAGALAGQTNALILYSPGLHTEIADVWLPVFASDGQLKGVVRLSHHLFSVREQFVRLRFLIVSVLVGGLLLGTVVALVLAIALERPLQRATRALLHLITEREPKPLPEQGPRELRLLTRAVNILGERLTNLEQTRRQLLSNLVHELGRPLGSLNSAIYVLLGLKRRDDPSLRQELLVAMKDEIARLDRLLDDLAHLQDQVLGTLALEPQPLALSDWLPGVLAPWREAARQKNLTWEAIIPSNLPTLEADPDRLAQVLGNLVSNAIKYTPSGGTVSIRANLEADTVSIRVSDTGAGIAPADQVQIFTPFHRLSQNRDQQPGMGLGLSIARDLVVAHAGKLEVESVPGLGSHFTVRLPVRQAAKPEPRESSPRLSNEGYLINTI